MITTKAVPLALLVFLTGATQSTLRAGVACVNDVDCIPAGPDYFVTTAGTFFTIAGVPVPLMGIPSPANFGADTVVQRMGNIDLPDVSGATQMVTTQMTLLSLTGIDPSCPQTGGPCNVVVSLDPNNPTFGNLTFTQAINGEGSTEGRFTSFFDVFFDLSFTTLGGAPLPCDANGNTTCLQAPLALNGAGDWTDDNGPLFIVGGQVSETHPSPPGVHDAQQILTPEPFSSLLFGTGLAALLALAKKRR